MPSGPVDLLSTGESQVFWTEGESTAVTWPELRLLIVRSSELSEHAKAELIRCGDRVCLEDQDGEI